MEPAVLVARSGSAHRMSWLFLVAAVVVTLVAIAVIFAGRRFGWLPRAPRELAHLPREQQRLVLRAVQRGEAVTDSFLAPAAVAHANTAASRLERFQGRGWLTFVWVLAGMFALVAVTDLVGERDVVGSVFQCFLAAIWIANPYLQRLQYRRARQAAELNLEVLRRTPGTHLPAGPAA